MIDLHLHTVASHDGLGTVMEYCESALANGVTAIAVTDHLDFDTGLSHANSIDLSEIIAEVEDARRRWGDRLKVLVGVEVTYQSEYEESIARACMEINADFIIGSVHSIGGADYTISEQEGARNYFKGKLDAKEAYEPYFEEVLRAVKFGHFDALGHIDGIKRYGNTVFEPLCMMDYYGVIRRILEGIIKRDMALEVNSSGLFHPVQEIYPSHEILNLYRELGGRRLTLGSDAHRPAELARGFDHAMRSIRKAGFDGVTLFECREPAQVPLP